MSERVRVGTVRTISGGRLCVAVEDEGNVWLSRSGHAPTILDAEAAAQLRELLDRAAMPGQPAPAAGDGDRA